MNSNYEALLALTRLGINHPTDLTNQEIDWQSVKDLAEKQGLSAVVLDGIERLPEQQRPPKLFLLEWIGETLQGYEYRYDLYCKAIAELAGFYNSHGYKMMVLKGYACGIDWQKPEHRPCGDIDIWQFGQQKESDAALAKEKGVEIDSSHHHHTVFYWRDFMVENHYDFINVHRHKLNKVIESHFKELGNDDTRCFEISGEKVYMPSLKLHALFLLRHTMSHFAIGGISLRQLLDWGFFVEKHTKEIDWDWLLKEIEQFGMSPLYHIFNAICVEDLGFDSSIFPTVQFDSFLKERVLNDILLSDGQIEEPKSFIKRIVFKYRRWYSSRWKHELCYKESMWSAFWSGVWSHMLKPASI